MEQPSTLLKFVGEVYARCDVQDDPSHLSALLGITKVVKYCMNYSDQESLLL